MQSSASKVYDSSVRKERPKMATRKNTKKFVVELPEVADRRRGSEHVRALLTKDERKLTHVFPDGTLAVWHEGDFREGNGWIECKDATVKGVRRILEENERQRFGLRSNPAVLWRAAFEKKCAEEEKAKTAKKGPSDFYAAMRQECDNPHPVVAKKTVEERVLELIAEAESYDGWYNQDAGRGGMQNHLVGLAYLKRRVLEGALKDR
jgi:hypothetical protein